MSVKKMAFHSTCFPTLGRHSDPQVHRHNSCLGFVWRHLRAELGFLSSISQRAEHTFGTGCCSQVHRQKVDVLSTLEGWDPRDNHNRNEQIFVCLKIWTTSTSQNPWHGNAKCTCHYLSSLLTAFVKWRYCQCIHIYLLPFWDQVYGKLKMFSHTAPLVEFSSYWLESQGTPTTASLIVYSLYYLGSESSPR